MESVGKTQEGSTWFWNQRKTPKGNFLPAGKHFCGQSRWPSYGATFNSLVLEFSTGAILTPIRHSAVSADIFHCHTGGEGCYWHLVGRGPGCC